MYVYIYTVYLYVWLHLYIVHIYIYVYVYMYIDVVLVLICVIFFGYGGYTQFPSRTIQALSGDSLSVAAGWISWLATTFTWAPRFLPSLRFLQGVLEQMENEGLMDWFFVGQF